MKRVPLLVLAKVQLCVLMIIMIFCKINGVPLSTSFYMYFFSSLTLLTVVSMFNRHERPRDETAPIEISK